MPLMKDRCCIVTGGAGSLGQASAERFLKEGAKVLLVDRLSEDLERAREALQSSDVLIATADVADARQTENYVKQAVEAWGRVDVLFSNAGVSGTNAPVTDYPEDLFDEVMSVNVKGTFLACKYVLPHMSPGGSIVVTSSIMGVQARPNSVGYITSKHAIVGFVRCLSREMAPKNIRVNAIAPGPIDNGFQKTIEDRMSETMGRDATAMLNEIIPLGRHAQVEEIAQTVLFLASEQSSFSTGSVFMADGGWHA
ncbi:MAG: SDR family NAD(P)-dependent oxidoreductase [Methyloligellaceae bacterium]